MRRIDFTDIFPMFATSVGRCFAFAKPLSHRSGGNVSKKVVFVLDFSERQLYQITNNE